MLNCFYRIYVPNCDRAGLTLPTTLIQNMAKRVGDKFTELFGGFTALGGIGGWKGRQEGVVLFESWCPSIEVERTEIIRSLCREIGQMGGQESVALVICENGLQRMEFITIQLGGS